MATIRVASGAKALCWLSLASSLAALARVEVCAFARLRATNNGALLH